MSESGNSFTRRGFLAGTGGAALAAGLAAAPAATAAPSVGPVDYVDPFIGALTTSPDSACGKTFPGATTPFGLVQLSPDTVSGGDNGSGYSWDMGTIEGFSFLHLSGIGCYGDLGNIQVMPQTGALQVGRDAAKSPYRKENEHASAGYYAVELDRYRVRAELTAAARSGMLRFTFHDNGPARIKVDLARRIGYDGTHSVAQTVRLVDAHTVEGAIHCDRSGGGWICGNGPVYSVYFSMKFQQPIARLGSWDGASVSYEQNERIGTGLGFFVEFAAHAGQPVLVKSGVSFTSTEGARASLAKDIPGWDFDALAGRARRTWSDALGKVTVQGGTEDQRRIFYTALYHTMIDPRVSGDNGTGRRTVFSGWDVFRAQFPLLTIIDHQTVADTVNTLIGLTESGAVKGLARWELLGVDTDTMLGDAAVNVIAEAYLKGVKGFDADKAYQLCRNVALGPAEQSNRSDFANWARLGYCADGNSISSTLENCYTDYALALFADKLGRSADAAALRGTSANYRNIFDAGTGWFRGRHADGSWMAPDAGCIESNPGQQGWYVPHDVAGLVGLVGGRQAFTDRLNAIFEATPPSDMMKWNANYNHSNEPVQQMAFMFAMAGSPSLTQKWSRYICEHAYATGAAGLAGNDDCGQMSAWYVLAAAGLYPVAPASGQYVIGSPVFDRIDFATATGNRFTVQAVGNSPTSVYVRSAELNGKALDRPWITHAEVMAGGRLTLRMGDSPVQ